MYCIKCGVKLADAPNACPLCGTVPYHPEITCQESERLYPEHRYPASQLSPKGALIVTTTVLFLLPILITLLCDLQFNGGITWSGYVSGALAVMYVPLMLPWWFRRRNPVIFVPCTFLAMGLYLLYISLATGGGWFLSFAFPITGGVALSGILAAGPEMSAQVSALITSPVPALLGSLFALPVTLYFTPYLEVTLAHFYEARIHLPDNMADPMAGMRMPPL
jgi:hypothetical protein